MKLIAIEIIITSQSGDKLISMTYAGVSHLCSLSTTLSLKAAIITPTNIEGSIWIYKSTNSKSSSLYIGSRTAAICFASKWIIRKPGNKGSFNRFNVAQRHQSPVLPLVLQPPRLSIWFMAGKKMANRIDLPKIPTPANVIGHTCQSVIIMHSCSDPSMNIDARFTAACM